MNDRPCSNQANIYRIEVKGKLKQRWSTWLAGMTITYEMQSDDTLITVLTGTITDQSALHGLLARIRDLNLELISVTRLKQE
jgi:hypothetical protein